MITHLENELVSELSKANKVYIAVALLKEYGINAITASLPPDCEQFYVLGVDLPTSPNVLENLFQKESERHKTRIFQGSENYHPKVYLIENKNDGLVAFVGSANATKGGWTHNVELSFRVDNPKETQKIKSWFWDQFERSKPLTTTFISDYRNVYSRNRTHIASIRSNNDIIDEEKTNSADNQPVHLSQFFTESDFFAFDSQFHLDHSKGAVTRRAAVRNKLIHLHDLMYERFPEFGMMNIYPARRRNNLTSQHFHSRGNYDIRKSALWLNYGKNIPKFTNHFRLQVIFINRQEKKIGYWLYGTPFTCHEDRLRLRNRLENDNIFLDRLYFSIINLGASYELELSSFDTLNVGDLKDREQLRTFLLEDSPESDFIIGRDYHPNDPRISVENIVENTLSEFARLYLVYSLLTDPNS